MVCDTDIIKRAAETVLGGGTILYPTDTIWGIGCDSTNETAVEQLYRLKGRDRSKSMLVLSDSMRLIDQELQHVYETMRRQSDRPTTFIVPVEILQLGRNDKKVQLAGNLIAADGTIGVRIPRHDFCLRLLQAVGRPIVSTSANLSGKPSPRRHDEIADAIVKGISYSVPPLLQWESRETQSSRIIKITPTGVEVIRN